MRGSKHVKTVRNRSFILFVNNTFRKVKIIVIIYSTLEEMFNRRSSKNFKTLVIWYLLCLRIIPHKMLKPFSLDAILTDLN